MTDPRLPPLPSLRALTAELRELNEAYKHPIGGASYVALCCVRGYDLSGERSGWRLVEIGSLDSVHGDVLERCGREEVPGTEPFDATAAARRLLAAARDAMTQTVTRAPSSAVRPRRGRTRSRP